MKTAADILAQKRSATLYFVSPETTVLEAITIMADKQIGSLLVFDHEKFVGLMSERDYLTKVVLLERSSYSTTVQEVMSTDIITVGPGVHSEECLAIISSRKQRHLPVLDNHKVLGVISIGDIVLDIINDQKITITHLENYIQGN